MNNFIVQFHVSHMTGTSVLEGRKGNVKLMRREDAEEARARRASKDMFAKEKSERRPAESESFPHWKGLNKPAL
jgi:hypothetical protein